MTLVSFYVLPVAGLAARRLFACQLAEKAFRQGHAIYLHTDTTADAEAVDELLWNYRPQSFVPHTLGCADANRDHCRVTVGCGPDAGDHHDILINLSLTIPDFFSRFERVTEIVVEDDALLIAKRDNFRFYKQRGYPNEYHRVTAAQLRGG